MAAIQKITPCLWFDSEAEEATNYYISIFKNSKITEVLRYSDEGQEIHGREPGSVMVVSFELDGQSFSAMNGGPLFKFNEALSLQIICRSQDEIDYYWEKLCAGGDKAAQQCGWLKDKYGLSWQVMPDVIPRLFKDHASEKTRRAMRALLEMGKIDIDRLLGAYEGP